jgi:glycogen phosphorylase
LNLLEAIARWRAICAEPGRDWVPRVKIIAGKAAPSYTQAKLIIKLINDVAAVVNRDPVVGDRLKIVFLPNYNVSLAQIVIPAADLSEQISTAGMEASGTGNMKLALNGALTIGTLDGANIEIRDHVGAENIVIFGLRAEEVAARRARGLDAGEAVASSPPLAGVLEDLANGVFSPEEPGRFAGLAERLRYADPYMVAADFASYCEAQARIDALWRDPAAWRRMCLLNIAGMGWFSSDRVVAEYAEDIWNVPV